MTTWNSNIYTGQIGSAGASLNAASGFPLAQMESGKLRSSVVQYALNGNESANDVINIIKLKIGSKIIPSMSRVVCEDPGTALTINIGDAGSATRYVNGAALTTAHDDMWSKLPSVTATASQYVPFAVDTDANGVIKATVTTATSLTAAAKMLFLVTWIEP